MMQIFLARQRAKCDHLIWMMTNLSLRSEKKQLMSETKSTDLAEISELVRPISEQGVLYVA